VPTGRQDCRPGGTSFEVVAVSRRNLTVAIVGTSGNKRVLGVTPCPSWAVDDCTQRYSATGSARAQFRHLCLPVPLADDPKLLARSMYLELVRTGTGVRSG
jgi:hypothetical protein